MKLAVSSHSGLHRTLITIGVPALLALAGSHALAEVRYTVTDLGTLGGGKSYAKGINNHGQVVGWVDTGSGYTRAFLYSDGSMTDLGTLGGHYSFAYGINNNGQIVGSADTGSGDSHAFLYSGGSMTDLNSLIAPDSGWTLSGSTGINDNGQVVGTGSNPFGQTHAFLLTPIPEPGVLALLSLCGAAVLLRRRPNSRNL